MNELGFDHWKLDRLGFKHVLLSCGFCQAGDRVKLDEAPEHEINDWIARHRGCEKKAREKWPARRKTQ